MKKASITLVLLVMIVCLCVCFGCGAKNNDVDANGNVSQPTVNDVSVLDSVQEGMTLESALELLGKARPNEASAMYPLNYSWIVGDGILYMVFKSENHDEFWQAWCRGDYVLEDEILEYGENGIRKTTKHELEVLLEHNLNNKATSAYVKKDGVITTLFDKASQSKTNDDNADDVDANGNVNDTNLNSSLNDDVDKNSFVEDINKYTNGTLPSLLIPGTSRQPTVNDVSVLDSVQEGMTLKSSLELLGKARPDESSADYPLFYSWIVGDGILYMVFKSENNDEFMQALRNGDYVLEDEILEYDENGFRIVTKHELVVLFEHRLNHKATSAYVMKDGVKTTLF